MTLDRRHFLRAAGVSLALPCLEALAPRRAFGAAAKPKRRMVCINTSLGMHPGYFFPEKAGKDYALSPYLEVIKDIRDDFTVISGLAHAGMSPGFAHQSEVSWLTGVGGAGRPGFRNAISVDQFAAEHIGMETRFPSLSMSGQGNVLSWTRTGAPVPSDQSPSRVFARLFTEGSREEVQAQLRHLRDGRSILDDVGGQAAKLQAGLGAGDRDKLDEYFTSVRDLEQRLAAAEQWALRKKPVVNAKPPVDIPRGPDLIGRTRLMFDMAFLALQTDSTRLITIAVSSDGVPQGIPGVNLGYHDLSHHGKDPGKLEQLQKVEKEKMKLLHGLLKSLKQWKEEDGVSLLDRTMVLFGCHMGDASSHSVKNLPILLAGGGFKHGQHLAFDPKDHPPLCNLYVSMLQRLGIPTDKFGTAKSTLTGLDRVG
jgi:hypothetical protein